MSTNVSAGDKAGHDSSTEFEDRDVRALTEYMTVIPEGGDIFTVIGQNGGGEYQVDARKGRCTCPDHKHRSARCKHIRRVAFATGEEPIPAGVDGDAIDKQLGEHTDSTPRVVATDGGIIEAGDGGEILEAGEGDTDACTDRPDDCECRRFDTDGVNLACWACYRDGFEEPAGADDSVDDERDEPVRSEPADFGHGETTGVQDL